MHYYHTTPPPFFFSSSTYRLADDDDVDDGPGIIGSSPSLPDPSSLAPSLLPHHNPSPPQYTYQLCSDPAPADKWHVGADIWPDNTLHVMEAEVLGGAVQALVVIEGKTRRKQT